MDERIAKEWDRIYLESNLRMTNNFLYATDFLLPQAIISVIHGIRRRLSPAISNLQEKWRLFQSQRLRKWGGERTLGTRLREKVKGRLGEWEDEGIHSRYSSLVFFFSTLRIPSSRPYELRAWNRLGILDNHAFGNDSWLRPIVAIVTFCNHLLSLWHHVCPLVLVPQTPVSRPDKSIHPITPVVQGMKLSALRRCIVSLATSSDKRPSVTINGIKSKVDIWYTSLVV